MVVLLANCFDFVFIVVLVWLNDCVDCFDFSLDYLGWFSWLGRFNLFVGGFTVVACCNLLWWLIWYLNLFLFAVWFELFACLLLCAFCLVLMICVLIGFVAFIVILGLFVARIFGCVDFVVYVVVLGLYKTGF